jgi:hypothetical protein
VGGTVGDPFIFGGTSYSTTAFFDDLSTDLRICEVDGTFPSWAPIYRLGGEVGQTLVVFGEGVGRGNPVQVDGVTKGWMWGSGSGTMRWGQGSFSSVVNGGAYWGSLLYSPFQVGAGPNEVDLVNGDSSSPVFINDASGWTLAGIAAAVDGPFNTTDMGSGFSAAIFDASGLYVFDSGGGKWVLIPDVGSVATGFYSTRVSAWGAWIDSIVPLGGVGDDSPLFSGVETALLAAAVAAVGAHCASRTERAEGSG